MARARVIGKKELCSTDLKYFKAQQGIQGKTLFDRYPSIKTIVENNIDQKYQDFIAHPVKDADVITFYGKPYKETPRLLSDLHGDLYTKYSDLLEETHQHYLSKITTLKSSGKTTESEFLENALKYIDHRFVYCYDDQVVLGVWGMQLRENVREDIREIRKNLIIKRKKQDDESNEQSPESEPQVPPELPTSFTISFNAGENGNLNGNSFVTKAEKEFLTSGEVPDIEPNEGFEFVGWNENPAEYQVAGDKEFTAQYRALEPEPSLPWYRRFWNWLLALFTDRSCLRWLLWLLLILLLIWLLSWLLRDCSGFGHHVFDGGGGALNDNDNGWVQDDPNVGDNGGIYDPYNPYAPVPTPPEHQELLPPQQGVLPPIEDNPDVIPGNPSILGNRLNILMENQDKSIVDLAKDFKVKYPSEKYKVVYYDDVVKRMQIEIPADERLRLKEQIPIEFAPEYELFVFDETLFEGSSQSSESSEEAKPWYLDAVNAKEAWGITQGSENITIAIVDNGFNLRHPELRSKVVAPYNVWTHSNEVFPQQIDHGTHVAGIALARADDGKGISGIAPNCAFMPVQVANEQGMMTITSVLDGILYALYQGADVINVSLSGKFTGLSEFPENEQKELIQNHFKEEERLWRRVMRIAADHNATLVVAAGNDNVLAGIEALQRPELFITVSATDKDNRNFNKARFSNYGSYSTISAPGVDIYSSVGDNDYQIMQGTSMAAPIVSGGVALMKSLKSTITTKELICVLKTSGLETQGNIGKLIQLDKALQIVESNQVVDCTPTPSSGDVQILLNWENYNDLDLICTDPYGETIFYRNRTSSSGGHLEIDMNVEYPDTKNPIENIFWEPDSAPEGTYNVYLKYYKKHEPNIDETGYNIRVNYGDETKEYNGFIKKEDNVIPIGSFTLGQEGDNSESQTMIDRRRQLEQERERLQRELDRVNRELRNLLRSN